MCLFPHASFIEMLIIIVATFVNPSGLWVTEPPPKFMGNFSISQMLFEPRTWNFARWYVCSRPLFCSEFFFTRAASGEGIALSVLLFGVSGALDLFTRIVVRSGQKLQRSTLKYTILPRYFSSHSGADPEIVGGGMQWRIWKARRRRLGRAGVWCGEGVYPLPTGDGSGEGARPGISSFLGPLPRIFF